MSKKLETYQDLVDNIGKKVKFKEFIYGSSFKPYEETHEGILELHNKESGSIECDKVFITTAQDVANFKDDCIPSNILDIELIEEDNQEPKQIDDIVDSTKHAIDLASCKTKETVNHPLHYQGQIECITYLADKLTTEQLKGFCLGNALKYLSRCGKKDNELDDIKKANWYLNYLITTMEK